MDIIFKINKELSDIKINVSAPSVTEEVTNILKTLEECKKEKIYVTRDDEIHEINLKEVICFYTEDKGVCVRTSKGNFRTRYRMYEIEEKYLTNKFLRISNAVIVNTEHVKFFNTGQIGNIVVKLDDGTEEYVSKRRIPQILKILKGRID